MRILLSLLGFVILLHCFFFAAQEKQLPTAKVKLEIQSFLGETIKGFTVRLTEEGTRKDFSKNFDGHTADGIPFGQYLLEVQAKGFETHRQHLRVYQSFVTTRVFLRVWPGHDIELSRVVGYVTPAPGVKQELWVKMLPLLSNESLAETQVQPDGRFQVSGLEHGDYVLVLMKGTQALYMKQVALYGVVKIAIPLAQTPRGP